MNLSIFKKNIYVILVHPVYKGNIGAIARVMNNFDFSNLRIVGTIPSKEDFWTGVHSDELLENTTTFNSLADAISDLDRVVSFSRRSQKNTKIDFSPIELKNYLSDLNDIKIGLVFGRETFGLTNEEKDLCQLSCYIDTSEHFGSLNLAQAVAIILYELSTISLNNPEKKSSQTNIKNTTDYIINTLNEMKYFSSGNAAKIEKLFNNIFTKANITKEDAYLIKQLFNRILVLNKGVGKDYK